MKSRFPFFLIAVLVGLSLRTAELPAHTHTAEEAIVDAATRVLDEFMQIPTTSIPRFILDGAEGIAIVPDVVKVGFIVGVRYGRGVVLVRDETGAWKPPVFVTLTGGSVGWQAGVQGTDVILVFKTRKSVVGLTRRKLIIGVDAAAAVGPVGREATAATDIRLRAEVYSYSRSRGVFAGVSLDGSDLKVDQFANQAFYHGRGVTLDHTPFADDVPLPLPAVKLMQRLTHYTMTTHDDAMIAMPGNVVAGNYGSLNTDSQRGQLANSAQRLQGLLEKQWQSYLALPAEVFEANKHPSVESLHHSLRHFHMVANDPRYRALFQRPEFQKTYELLKEYAAARASHPAAQLKLPPPPIQDTYGIRRNRR